MGKQGNFSGSKAARINELVGWLSTLSKLPRNESPIKALDIGLERFNMAELAALKEVVNTIVTLLEKRISAAAEHHAPTPVPKYTQAMDYPTLNKANQGGDVEEQIDCIPGLGEKMQEAWQSGNIGLCKRYMLCVDKVCRNVEGVIKAQLYDGLK